MEKELTDMTVDARIDLGPGGEVLSTWIPRASPPGWPRAVRPLAATRHQRSERT
jgi:hypothetical protein